MCPRVPQLQLNRNAELGTVLTTLVVTDADINENALIVYEDIRGNFAPQFFDVNQQTGEIVIIG